MCMTPPASLVKTATNSTSRTPSQRAPHNLTKKGLLPDVWYLVFNSPILGASDMRSLSLVCRAFQHDAQPLVFGDISFTFDDPSENTRQDQISRFNREQTRITFLKQDRIWFAVRRLTLKSRALSPGPVDLALPTFASLFDDVLHLTEVRFLLCQNLKFTPDQLSQLCSLPNLRHLNFHLCHAVVTAPRLQDFRRLEMLTINGDMNTFQNSERLLSAYYRPRKTAYAFTNRLQVLDRLDEEEMFPNLLSLYVTTWRIDHGLRPVQGDDGEDEDEDDDDDGGDSDSDTSQGEISGVVDLGPLLARCPNLENLYWVDDIIDLDDSQKPATLTAKSIRKLFKHGPPSPPPPHFAPRLKHIRTEVVTALSYACSRELHVRSMEVTDVLSAKAATELVARVRRWCPSLNVLYMRVILEGKFTANGIPEEVGLQATFSTSYVPNDLGVELAIYK